MDEVTYSGYWKHESACDLFEPGHEIRRDFVEVLKAAAGTFDHEVEYYSAGCGCATPDAATYLWWKAQTDATEKAFIHFGSDTVDAEAVAKRVLDAAEELGVEVSWSGSTDDCICLGDAGYYDERDDRDAYEGVPKPTGAA